MEKWANGPFHKFYGWDWSELLWKWQMYQDDKSDEGMSCLEYVIGRCLNTETFSAGKRKSCFHRRAIADMREFVGILGRIAGYYAPFWKGLSKVKNDFAFLQLFYCCCGHAWT